MHQFNLSNLAAMTLGPLIVACGIGALLGAFAGSVYLVFSLMTAII